MHDEMIQRVLLVDDHDGVRAALRAGLERNPSIRVVAEASDGDTAVRAAKANGIDAVLLDLSMPGVDGRAALPALRKVLPDARIVVFSGQAEQLGTDEAARLGADAVVAKHEGLAGVRAALA